MHPALVKAIFGLKSLYWKSNIFSNSDLMKHCLYHSSYNSKRLIWIEKLLNEKQLNPTLKSEHKAGFYNLIEGLVSADQGKAVNYKQEDSDVY